MEALTLTSRKAQDTAQLGEALGALAQPGDLFFLTGALGTGKTVLAQGIARGLDVPEWVTSPTFVLVNEYRGRLPLYHIDLYRLDTPQEVSSLGLDDYLFGDGVCVVEWAEKAASVRPLERLDVLLEHRGKSSRQIELAARGDRYRILLAELTAALAQLRHHHRGF